MTVFLARADAEGALKLAERACELAGEESTPFSLLAALHLAKVWDEGFGDEERALEYHKDAVRRLGDLLETSPDEALRIMEAKKGSRRSP